MSIPETKSFVSHSKLMLSGEYAVLNGALSLAVPLRFKQKLTVHEIKGIPSVNWESMINNCLWFYATLLLPDFQIPDTNIPVLSETLRKILVAAKALNPSFLDTKNEYQAISEMDFDPDWGIGSSSSLISNIAYWAGCDPFQLNFQVFNGSGYDIACSRAMSPIIYELRDNKPNFREANFHPSFHHQLWFVYLNRKQSSKESISTLDHSVIKAEDLRAITDLTLDLEKATDLFTFQSLIDQHETIIAKIILLEPVKKRLFHDFDGSVKSLGAWGGDFILAASSEPEEYVRDYFKNKNLETIFRYNEIVLNF
jgi:mevalonate kinase